jgi:hypothetical protein
MKAEFDHLFICTEVGAPAADRLVALGLIEGLSNTHPGQGTANRCFFFHNAMLELLWVHDPIEAQSEVIQRTRLWERWEGRASGDRICPFGICLRPATDPPDPATFPHWDYHPPYLPETLSIAIATNSDVLTEPLLFQIPFGKRPDQRPPAKVQPLDHPLGFREITRVEIITPATATPSPELQTFLNNNHIKIRNGLNYCIELGFDGERQGQQMDLRSPLVQSTSSDPPRSRLSDLPLLICW